MNKFNFNRFGKVVVRDFHNTNSLFGMSMLIIMLIPAFVWLTGWAFKAPSVDVFTRRSFIELAVYLTAAIASMKIYNSCNLVGKGNYFAMLPASLCEKFTSMALYSFIVCPLVVFVGSTLVDIILTVLPFGPYKEYIWQAPDWLRQMNTLGGYTTGFGAFVLLIFKIFAVSSLFMLANTIFKKNKFVKTILWLMIIVFALIIIIVPIMNHINWPEGWNWIIKIGKWLGVQSEEHLLRLFYWGRLLLFAAMTFIFSLVTYHRLKKMQY